jgi:hypothetical protein
MQFHGEWKMQFAVNDAGTGLTPQEKVPLDQLFCVAWLWLSLL